MTAQKLKRLPRSDQDEPRHFHPHGYIIERNKRTWDERVGRIHGQADRPTPMYSWDVWHHVARRASMIEGRPSAFLGIVSEKHYPQTFGSFAEAREWCDEHPREGWQL